MSKKVRFRGQLLFVFAERRPTSCEGKSIRANRAVVSNIFNVTVLRVSLLFLFFAMLLVCNLFVLAFR